MAALLVFAFLAGLVTILSPCTLPVVPILLGVGEAGRGPRIAGFVAGFALTFVGVTVVFAAAFAAAGITTAGARLAAAVLVGLVGATLALPRLAAGLERVTAGLAGFGVAGFGQPALSDGTRHGLVRGLVLGSAVGLIWAPCAGPIMAAVIATAVTSGPTLESAFVAGAYVLGASVPLALVALGGRSMVRRLGGQQSRGRLRRLFGALMIGASVLVVTGLDMRFQVGLGSLVPPALTAALTSLEEQPSAVQEVQVPPTSPSTGAADASRTPSGVVSATTLPASVALSLPASVALGEYGAAPELAGITSWINSPPLTLASLRGNVVLVHFWTFGCINCRHVQPYVKAWADRYAAAGLVVVGVHTPELSFERDLANVRAAVETDGVRFPVAFDPAFATWNAYGNQYWPAFYFVDKAGQIRHVHFGEGDYEGSEEVIRQLLSEPG